MTAEQCTLRGAEPSHLQEQRAETDNRVAMSRLAAQLKTCQVESLVVKYTLGCYPTVRVFYNWLWDEENLLS